jgi:hypothetical protein
MTKKPRLTHEQHVDLGRALFRMHDELTLRYVEVANVYPRSGPESVAAKKLHVALQALRQARSALDSALFIEHSDVAEATVYYPGSEGRAAAGEAE